MTEYDYLIGKKLVLLRNEGLLSYPSGSTMVPTRFSKYGSKWWVSGTITTPDGISSTASFKLDRFSFPAETEALPDEELASIYRKSFSELISVRNELIKRGWSISVENGPPREIHIVKTITTTTTTNI